MIRLLAVLGAFLFMALWFLGEDHGQVINPPHERPQMLAVAAKRPVFLPAQRVMEPQAPPPEAETVAAPVLPEAAPPAEPVADLPALKLMHVPGGASVRVGPGREFAVIGDLARGDVVIVVDDTSSPGWVMIRVDGRGAGWVAAKLLRE